MEGAKKGTFWGTVLLPTFSLCWNLGLAGHQVKGGKIPDFLFLQESLCPRLPASEIHRHLRCNSE